MERMINVHGAYGRDYKTAKAAIEAWERGVDFIIDDVLHPDDGRYMSCRDLKPVSIRFNKNRDVVLYEPKASPAQPYDATLMDPEANK